MSFFRELKKLGQSAINTVFAVPKSMLESAGKSVSDGATSNAIANIVDTLTAYGIDKTFIDRNVVPALNGVTSIAELAATAQPWVAIVATAGTSLMYVMAGYFIIRGITDFLSWYAPNEAISIELKQAILNIERNTEFQAQMQLRQFHVEQQQLRLTAAQSVMRLQPSARPKKMSRRDRQRVSRGYKEACAIIDSPPVPQLSEEMINAMNVAMRAYLLNLFLPSQTLNSANDLLNNYSANMEFETVLTAINENDFSKIKLSANDALNFGYLDRVSNGTIGKFVKHLQQRLTDEGGNILAFACKTSSFLPDMSLYPNYMVFQQAIIDSYKLARSSRSIAEPEYRYNKDDASIWLALKYRELKRELLNDKYFIAYLNFDGNKAKLEQIVDLILNRALLGMVYELKYRFRCIHAPTAEPLYYAARQTGESLYYAYSYVGSMFGSSNQVPASNIPQPSLAGLSVIPKVDPEMAEPKQKRPRV